MEQREQREKKEPTRTKWLTVRMTREEYQAVEDLSRQTTCSSLSDYARKTLMGKPITHRHKEDTGKTTVTHQLNLFSHTPTPEPGVNLVRMQDSEHVVEDFATTGLSLRAHPLFFLRAQLRQLKAISAAEIKTTGNGWHVRTAGLILVRQRPGTANGVCFITLKDETGTINLIVWPKLFDEYRHQILGAKLLMVRGFVQHVQGVIHVVVRECYNLNHLLTLLTPDQQESPDILSLSRADEKDGTRFPDSLKQTKPFPEARNFK